MSSDTDRDNNKTRGDRSRDTERKLGDTGRDRENDMDRSRDWDRSRNRDGDRESGRDRNRNRRSDLETKNDNHRFKYDKHDNYELEQSYNTQGTSTGTHRFNTAYNTNKRLDNPGIRSEYKDSKTFTRPPPQSSLSYDKNVSPSKKQDDSGRRQSSGKHNDANDNEHHRPYHHLVRYSPPSKPHFENKNGKQKDSNDDEHHRPYHHFGRYSPPSKPLFENSNKIMAAPHQEFNNTRTMPPPHSYNRSNGQAGPSDNDHDGNNKKGSDYYGRNH